MLGIGRGWRYLVGEECSLNRSSLDDRMSIRKPRTHPIGIGVGWRQLPELEELRRQKRQKLVQELGEEQERLGRSFSDSTPVIREGREG